MKQLSWGLGAVAWLFIFCSSIYGPTEAKAATPRLKECSQFGGVRSCVLPYLGPWRYGDNDSFDSPEGQIAAYLNRQLEISEYYKSIGGRDSSGFVCSGSVGGARPSPVPSHDPETYAEWLVPLTLFFYEGNWQCSSSSTTVDYSAGGVRRYQCPPGYIETEWRPTVYQGREYPFFCARDDSNPPPPPPPPITGDPNSDDTNPPPPSVPPVPDPGPDPVIFPTEGGGGNRSGEADECSGVVGDPINTAAGNKFASITDYALASRSPLRFVRYYDSQMPVAGSMGSHWRHEYERRIETVSSSVITVRRADGKALTFTLKNGQWTASPDVNLTLRAVNATNQPQGWRVVTPRDDVEIYDAQGRLTHVTARGGATQSLVYDDRGRLSTVTDDYGRKLKFEYDSQNRLALLTDVAGKLYRYTYDAVGNLSSRITPENHTLSYLYERSDFPHALTGTVDGNGVRTDTTWYDNKGRAYNNERGTGVEKVAITYADDGNATVTDAYNTARSYSFQLIQGVMKATGLSRTCPTCGGNARNMSRDAQGNITSRTDFNGIRTTYTYDLSRNLETSRTEAVGTPVERTVTTEWHASYHLPTKITEPRRVTEMGYDDNGNMTSLVVTDVSSGEKRTWGYEYGPYGRLLSQTSPSGETISYEYDNLGNVVTATTSAGLVTRYSNYDDNGRVGAIAYPSGRTISFTYDAVGRVLSHEEAVEHLAHDGGRSWWDLFLDWLKSLFDHHQPWVDARGENGAAITRYTYDNAGLLSDVNLPDGDSLHYEYDAAYRPILVRDTLGNTIQIIRDPMGKPLEMQVADPNGVLAQSLHHTYDALGRIAQSTGNNGQRLMQSYDEEGYLTGQKDALGRHSSRQRDALYRTTAITDAANQTTLFGLDTLDQLISVTDARGNTTSYAPNAFGEVVQEQSPDRGNTQRTYQNGRLVSRIDGRGITHLYTYDADGRLKTRQSDHNKVTYHYDENSFGNGRLTRVEDNSGSTGYAYNSQGNVTEKVSHVRNGPTLRISYGYTLGGKLKEVGTPGHHLIQYGYDTQGRPASVSVDGRPLLKSIRFSASGIVGWTWGNGTAREEVRDLDGRITKITSGNALSRQYGFDAGNRLTSMSDAKASVNDSYGYDVIDRLITQAGTNTQRYQYDALGNRQQRQRQQGNQGITTVYQVDASSNRLLSETTGTTTTPYAYLPSGQISSKGTVKYTYDDDGRLTDARGQHPLHNDYNALGQRVRKIGHGVLVFAYDEAGHLLGEYTPGGEMEREYIWLGNRLVGMLSRQERNAILYIHADHLGTSRAVSNGNTVLWRWEGEVFGDGAPDERVAGPFRKFTMPLRFPGQYYDSETGLHYNYFRDYSPSTGRYIESDPIGLNGGINTYAYVKGAPSGRIDPLGLVEACPMGSSPYCGTRPLEGGGVGGGYGGGAISPGQFIGGACVALGLCNISDSSQDVPELPTNVVGDHQRPSSGKRINTDLPGESFPEVVDDLTGGNTSDQGGQRVCPNGVRVRPGKTGQGPRVDIPANGTKPPETIHFPPGTPWPW